MRRLTRWFAALAVAVLPFMACGDYGTEADAGRLSIYLTDDPGDFKAAVVTISEIYLQGSSDEDPPTTRVPLLDDPVEQDLLELVNDFAELVSEKEVPAGTYGQLRFVIDGGYIVVEGENETTTVYATQDYPVPDTLTVGGTLMCPSCGETGIKVILEGLEVNEQSKIVMVDFDVAETFGQQAGMSGMWVMHPTLKATLFELTGQVQVNATVADTVTLPTVNGTQVTLADFEAELKGADADPGTPGERVALADDDGDGTFTATFQLVVPADYDVGLVAPSGVTFTTDVDMPAEVTVESNATASVEFTLTSAGT